ncbi:hypothetical protein [Schaalia hyovaginalis]|uniref:Uncharacterized protein n=1 Tax=Schaalia hyovaginalis TaxID=29316 RepID=A0A923E411_9ACTO|nr:hypothetical protein [Schaalia hyovaginalis]MBB6335529.1 hypothetical protein [Schaalia hyovaginalis]
MRGRLVSVPVSAPRQPLGIAAFARVGIEDGSRRAAEAMARTIEHPWSAPVQAASSDSPDAP